MLRNPTYRGIACYAKTERRPRQPVTRPLRERKAFPSRDVGGPERPRAEWIKVPVPAPVSEENRPIRQDYLDTFVWSETMVLLEEPDLIHRRRSQGVLPPIQVACHIRGRAFRPFSFD
jgi:hypothetical protein